MLRLFLALLLLTASPALAEDAAAPVPADMKQRISLATDYHDIVQIRDIINRDIDDAASTLIPEDREAFMRDIQLRIDYDSVEALSIKKMAEVFTVAELRAMVAYYGSPEGKSVLEKMPVYIEAVSPVVRQSIDAAIMTARYGADEPPPSR